MRSALRKSSGFCLSERHTKPSGRVVHKVMLGSCCVLARTAHQITLEVTMFEHKKLLCERSENGGRGPSLAVAYSTLAPMQVCMQHASLVRTLECAMMEVLHR